MTARFHCAVALVADSALVLPPGAARHVQVLRMQPGDALTLFDGHGGEYAATVERMGRSEVAVQVGAHTADEREAPRAVHLAVGMSYPETGGTNDSAVHWDMVCDLRQGGRITVDGEPLQVDGRFQV